MGKTKWYSATETSQQEFDFARRHTTSQRTRRENAHHVDGGIIQSNRKGIPAENLPLPDLMRLMWTRFRRSLIALRYQSKKYTFGLVTPRVALNGGLVGMAGWLLLSNSSPVQPIVFQTADHNGFATETSLDISSSKSTPRANRWKSSNEAAPVSASELYDDQVKDYIERFGPIAQKEMAQFRIPASISLAQGLIESRAGTSKLAKNNNNHFGIKCFSRRCKKGHCSNFTDDTHKDFFRKFESPWESWREHSKLLASGRYRRLQKYGSDYRQWAFGLESVGYATDRSYAEKLIGIIQRYNLHRFDR
ncbi:MAG: glucosaminidase domain-containing protein [Saprospiraceae bacterium]|nr:glucosaminidase domain-containing protein [Saprospiraceae bacterium]